MPIDGAILATLLQTCAPKVAPATMRAIIRVESEGDPYKIGVNSGSSLRRQPTNVADAIATARSLSARGANYDAGLMQINSKNFDRLGLTPETVFDPCTNLRAGAVVLADNYVRARDDGHSSPLNAALSEYNTGSRSKGARYVRRIYAAAGLNNTPFPASRPVQVVSVTHDGTSLERVKSIILATFGGRITDAWRPRNATYGATNSFHKVGQAIDFVPGGGLHSINRDLIRKIMAANGVQLIELLGPGDAGHSDHWHIAFATGEALPAAPSFYPQPAPWSVAIASNEQSPMPSQSSPYQLAATIGDNVEGEPVQLVARPPDPQPPAWDVFGMAAWQRRQMSVGGGS